jgi:hypothetical protein
MRDSRILDKFSKRLEYLDSKLDRLDKTKITEYDTWVKEKRKCRRSDRMRLKNATKDFLHSL